jgi:hypothetical protein
MDFNGASNLTPKDISSYSDRRESQRHAHVPNFKVLHLDERDGVSSVYRRLDFAFLVIRLVMRYAVGTASMLWKKSLSRDLVVDPIMEGRDADTNVAIAGPRLGTYLDCT